MKTTNKQTKKQTSKNKTKKTIKNVNSIVTDFDYIVKISLFHCFIYKM